jgi:hypothetical protein
LRSAVFDIGLVLTAVGMVAALWVAGPIIALAVKFYGLRFLGEGGADGAIMNLSAFILALLFMLVGVGILLVGVVRVRRGA